MIDHYPMDTILRCKITLWCLTTWAPHCFNTCTDPALARSPPLHGPLSCQHHHYQSSAPLGTHFVLGVDVCPGIRQRLYNLEKLKSGGRMEGRPSVLWAPYLNFHIYNTDFHTCRLCMMTMH